MDAFNPIAYAALTITTWDAWEDIDVSPYVPVGATGVILNYRNRHDTRNFPMGLRKKGSGDNRTSILYDSGTHGWAMIGVDANRFIQIYLGLAVVNPLAWVDISICGYTGPQVVFFDNGTEKTPPNDGAWHTIDCSAQVPAGAIGLIFECEGQIDSIRNAGSSDERLTRTIGHNCFGWIVGCNSSRQCEAHVTYAGGHMWLIGYVKSGAVFNLDGDPKSLGVIGSWETINVPVTAGMVFMEVHSTGLYSYGLVPSGTGWVGPAYYHPMGFIEVSGAHTIQGKISNLACDFFILGYSTKEFSSTGSQADAMAKAVLI